MAVDLVDLVPSLKAQVSPPGTDLFPNVTNTEWTTRLENAFWMARLDGLFLNYRALDGNIEPLDDAGEDLDRASQQLVVLYAAMDIVLAELRNAQGSFRAQAGPVQFEQTRSAQLMRDILKAIQDRIKNVVGQLTSYAAAPVSAFDAVIARTESIGMGDVWWVR